MTRHPSAVVDTSHVGDGVDIGAFCVVGPDVTLYDGVRLHPHVVISGAVEVGTDTEVFTGAVVGKPPARSGALRRAPARGGPTVTGAGCSAGARAVVQEGALVGPGTLIGDSASVRESVEIGSGCLIGRFVSVHPDCRIGDGARVMDHTHLATATEVGRGSFLGIHVVTMSDNALGRLPNDPERVRGPRIGDGAAIGSGAMVLPGVRVGCGATVAAGAVVTRDDLRRGQRLVGGVREQVVEAGGVGRESVARAGDELLRGVPSCRDAGYGTGAVRWERMPSVSLVP